MQGVSVVPCVLCVPYGIFAHLFDGVQRCLERQPLLMISRYKGKKKTRRNRIIAPHMCSINA